MLYSKFISRFSFRDENGMRLSDAVEIVLIELTKLTDIIAKPVEAMTGEELWSIFFAYGSDPKHSELPRRRAMMLRLPVTSHRRYKYHQTERNLERGIVTKSARW